MRRMKWEHLLCYTDSIGMCDEMKHFTSFAFTWYPHLNASQILLKEDVFYVKPYDI